MRIHIENITFEITSKEDLILFTDFYESHLSNKPNIKRYTRNELLSFKPNPQSIPQPIQPTNHSLFQPFGGRRGNKTTRNRANRLRKLKRKKKEKDESFQANKVKSKTIKATYEQQKLIEFNPFFHQVPGLLRNKSYIKVTKPLEKKKLDIEQYTFEQKYCMPTYYVEKLKARKDFLKTEYPLYDPDDFTYPSFDECIDQLNAVYYDIVNFKPKYNEMWWTLHKAIEAGDTYYSTLSSTRKSIFTLSFPTRPFQSTYTHTIFSFLNRTNFLEGENEIVLLTEFYRITAHLTDPVIHLKDRFGLYAINLRNNKDLTEQEKTDKFDEFYEAISEYITRFMKEPRNAKYADQETKMRSALLEMVRTASR